VPSAEENARSTIAAHRVRWMSDRDKTSAALSLLQDELDLPAPPRRIECYDISTIQGTNTVASMVVFEDGAPLTSNYRRFRIKTVEGQDDFASMREVLTRRFSHLAEKQRKLREEERQEIASDDENTEPEPASAWDIVPDLVV